MPLPTGGPAGPLADIARRRWEGTFTVDPWGLDTDLAAVAHRLCRLRWTVDVTGASHIPAVGPVALVFARRWGLSEPAVLAHGVHRSTGRLVRVTGAPDLAPVGPCLRRLGAVSGCAADAAELLAGGEAVALALSPRGLRRGPGRLDPQTLEPVVEAGAPLLPVAMRGREVGRRWDVAIGPPVDLGRGPVDLERTAARLRSAIAGLP